MSALSQFDPNVTARPGRSAGRICQAQSISVGLDHSAPRSLPSPALPHCLYCPVGLYSTTTSAHIPLPLGDSQSLIPSALMVIKSDLKGHSIPSPPVIAAQEQEVTPQIT